MVTLVITSTEMKGFGLTGDKSYKLCTSDGYFSGIVVFLGKEALTLGGLPEEARR